MSKSGIIESLTLNLPFDNIDTDQIIPAQFLTTTERDGLGRYCFYHWRFHADGSKRANDPLASHVADDHQVLVAGPNFGCGSSREHAPWGLLDLGFRAVISSRFADIFRSNSLKNGLLPVEVDQEVVDYLMNHQHHPVRIDIPARELQVEGLGSFKFPVDMFSAYCLAQGIDQMEYIMQHEADISGHEQASRT